MTNRFPEFEDLPSKNTAINSERLNAITRGLSDHEERVKILEQGGGTGGGHKILNANGQEMPQRKKLKAINMDVTDDETNDTTIIDGRGLQGKAATIEVGTVTTVENDQPAKVENVGTTSDAKFNFELPKGQDGTNGNDGKSVKSTLRDYQISTNGTTIPTATWSTTIPTVPKGQYLWQRDIDTFSDSTTSQPRYTVTYQGLDGLGSGDMTKSVYDTNNNGIVDKAEKLSTARTITLQSDITGSASFDGSSNVSITATLSKTGITAGRYSLLDVDEKGRVTFATRPKTISSLGITDVYTILETDTAINDVVENQAIINESLSTAIETKLSKPKIRTINLPLSGWVGEQYPIITLTGIAEIKSSKTLGKITYINQGATTDENYLTWKTMYENADLQPVNELQGVGKLVLKCWGEKPTTDLPILLLIGGEVE